MRNGADRRIFRLAGTALALLVPAGALAQHPSADAPAPSSASSASGEPAAAQDEATVRARAEYARGTALVKRSQWADALIAFEKSASLRSHPATLYNIGACERALGRYTRAERILRKALEADQAAGGGQLPESIAAEVRAWIDQIDQLLSRASVVLIPPNAAVAVDGRPLESRGRDANGPLLVAGTLDAGPGQPPGASRFTLALDPGVHVITLSRKGFRDAVVNRDFPPGKLIELKLELDRLPATLHVGSNPSGAIVSVEGADVGMAPVDVSRPAGSYRVVVRKQGYLAYETQVVVQPGEETNLKANLREDRPSLTQRWWFWTAAGVLVAGAVTGTYFATRSEPEPTRPALNGGGLGWTLQLR